MPGAKKPRVVFRFAPARAIARWTEIALWTASAGALGFCAFYITSFSFGQLRGERDLAALMSAPSGASAQREGRVVGRLRIPANDWSAIVFEGTGESVLRKGIGHLTGSALPASSGNVVLAAHRDTFFRNLQDVRVDDELVMETPGGAFRYVVRTSAVVPPSAVEVVRPTAAPTLTLITCYPFNFLGSAPDRFVVRAQLVSDRPMGGSK
jgi:sortase A